MRGNKYFKNQREKYILKLGLKYDFENLGLALKLRRTKCFENQDLKSENKK